MRMKTLAITLFVAAAATGAGCSRKVEQGPGSGAGSAAVVAPPAGSGSGSGSGSGAAAGSGSAAGSAAPTPPPVAIKPYMPPADASDAIKAAITATDRDDKDRALDAGRKPGETFSFFKLAPGQKIGELFAGGGYSTELMARIVGDGGKIYAQNTKDMLDAFARKPLTARLAKPVMKNVVMVEQPDEAPLPADAKDLDAVITIINYHDWVNQKVDRKKLNGAVFAALKKGGVYGIVDSSAAAGSGLRDTETLHRIDEESVKAEVTAAGFKLDGESDALRNPDDKRDWNTSPTAAKERRGTGDKFMLRFVKP